MDVLLQTSPPRHPYKRHALFFDSAEAPEALFIAQALGLSVVYNSNYSINLIKVHLGPDKSTRQDLIMSIQIYLKYKYTYENVVLGDKIDM